MAAVTAAVVVAAGSAYAANRQGAAADKAAHAQENAANLANGSAQQMYEQGRTDQQPFYNAGTNALAQLESLNSGDYSGFENSPDYLYARGVTQQGVERGASSRGSLYSGGTNVDLASALNGIASQNLGAYRNSLTNVAGMGQSSASAMNGLSQNYANQFGQNTYNAVQARASGFLAQGDTQAGYANALGNGIGAYFGASQPAPTTASSYGSMGAGEYGGFMPTTNVNNSNGSYYNWLANIGGTR